jgi:transcriptional regulator with PAS, ATPase and Fis domain
MISNDDDESGWSLWDVYPKIQRAAAVDSTVLILGESSARRKLAAQALHQNSPRKDGPFVAMNCAAMPASVVLSELLSCFRQADGGTLFLDAIGNLELGIQAKLLRVLDTQSLTPVGGSEDRTVNFRVLTASSPAIVQMVKEGTFREDLYYCVNVVTIELSGFREKGCEV